MSNPILQVHHTFNGVRSELAPLIVRVKWSGDIMQAARKLEVELSNTIGGKFRTFDVQEGAEIVFIHRDVELFRGVLFSDKINNMGKHTFVAYDANTYLVRNEDTVKLLKETGDAFIRRMCAKFGIPVGHIASMGYVIPKMIFRDVTLWDMFTMVITETRRRTGKIFVISCENGRFCLRERKTNAIQWVLENGVNLLEAEYERSIEDTRTAVKVTGENKKKKEIVATVSNPALVKIYGMMQHVEDVSGESTQAQLDTLARELLKQLGTIDDAASVKALGKADVFAGKAVYVKETMTQIIGGYYVATDKHEFFGNYHEMEVKLSATDELPQMDYDFEADREAEKKEQEKAQKATKKATKPSKAKETKPANTDSKTPTKKS